MMYGGNSDSDSSVSRWSYKFSDAPFIIWMGLLYISRIDLGNESLSEPSKYLN